MSECLSELVQEGVLRDAIYEAERHMIDREYEKALKAYLVATQTAVDTVGSRAPILGDLSCILSGLYEEVRKDNKRAAMLLTYAYSITLDVLEYNEPAVCKILFNLGRLHKAMGNNVLAEDAFTLSLSVVGGGVEADDPVVSHIFTSLGDLAAARDNKAAARDFYLKAQGAVRPEDWGNKIRAKKRREMEDRLLAFYMDNDE